MHLTIILGAGASAASGVPVMSGFFQVCDTLRMHGRINDYDGEFDSVLKFRKWIARYGSKHGLDHQNLERVFNAIEMASFLEIEPDQYDTASSCDQTRQDLVRLIAKTIVETQWVEAISVDPQGECSGMWPVCEYYDPARHQYIYAPPGYFELGRLCRFLIERSLGYRISVITFNYDCGIECGLDAAKVPYCYGKYNGDGVSIYKLHGSVNWILGEGDTLIGENESSVEPSLVTQALIGKRIRVRKFSDDSFQDSPEVGVLWPSQGHGAVRKKLHSASNILYDMESAKTTPFIVPPSEKKAEGRSIIADMWAKAAVDLSNSELVLISGYSIPDTDEFFRQFFAVSAISDTIIRQVAVNNIDKHCEARYRRLLGNILSGSLHYSTLPFTKWVSGLIDSVSTQSGQLYLSNKFGNGVRSSVAKQLVGNR